MKSLPAVGNCIFNTITGERSRVLYIDREQDTLFAIQMEQRLAYPVALSLTGLLEDENIVAEEKAEEPVSIADCAGKGQQEELEHRWNLISDFVLTEPQCYQKSYRTAFASKTAGSEGCTVYRINQMLYRYWSGGKSRNALLPNTAQRGGKGRGKRGDVGRRRKYSYDHEKCRILEEDEKNIRKVVNSTYNAHTKYSFQDAYGKLLREYYMQPDGVTLAESYPTKNQFCYHARQFIDVQKRYGTRKYEKDIRGHLGSSKDEARGPGDKYQVDATIGDVYLVSASDPEKCVGRPTVYSVVDVFSHAIAGIYVSLAPASWNTARKALFQAFRDKVAYCRYYGIEITEEQWPCRGIPKCILADNGEFNSYASDDLVKGLGISLENAAVWRADLKGIVEQSFHQINLSTKYRMPGAVIKDHQERGDEDYRRTAALTLYDYTQILILTVLKHNSSPMTVSPVKDQDFIEDGVRPIPNDIWNWGVQYRSGENEYKPDAELWLALLPRAAARITERGIRYKNLFYSCRTAIQEGWFDKNHGRIGEQCLLIIDPDNLENVNVILDDRTMETAEQTAASKGLFRHWTEQDLDLLSHRQRSTEAGKSRETQQNLLDYDRRIDEVISAASVRSGADKPIRIKKESGSQIRANRREEQRRDNVVPFSKEPVRPEPGVQTEEGAALPQSAKETSAAPESSARSLNEKILRRIKENSDGKV